MIKIMKKEERVTVRGRDIVIKYKHLIPNKYIIVTMLFLLLVNAGTSLVIPYATMKVIDKIDLKNIDIKLFFYLSIFILFSMLMAVLTSLAINGVGEMTVKKLRTKLWEKIIYLPISFFDDNSTGELMSRLTNDTQVLRDFISFTLTTFITSIVTVVGSFILLWIIDWKIAMVLCISVPVATLIILLISGREYKISKLLQDTYASWQGDMHRIISDIDSYDASSLAEEISLDFYKPSVTVIKSEDTRVYSFVFYDDSNIVKMEAYLGLDDDISSELLGDALNIYYKISDQDKEYIEKIFE